jgi:ADP-ribose pyrophosphatase YjhB (NUDIX family)
MSLHPDTIYQAIDELRAIAGLGLHYSRNEYDQERYQRVLSIALRLFALVEKRAFDEVMDEHREDNWLRVSPLAGAEAVILREGKIMLIKRSDSGLWAVPGGLVEVGETLAEAAERELHEETGVEGKVTQLLGIFDSRLWHSKTKAQLYHVIFLAEAVDPIPRPSNEATEIAFFDEANLPVLAAGHNLRVPMLFKLLRGEIPAPYFDALDQLVE